MTQCKWSRIDDISVSPLQSRHPPSLPRQGDRGRDFRYIPKQLSDVIIRSATIDDDRALAELDASGVSSRNGVNTVMRITSSTRLLVADVSTPGPLPAESANDLVSSVQYASAWATSVLTAPGNARNRP